MSCTEYQHRLLAECAHMYSDLPPQDQPNIGMLTIVVLVLAGVLIIDGISQIIR